MKFRHLNFTFWIAFWVVINLNSSLSTAVIQYKSLPSEFNRRSLTHFAVDTFADTQSARRCGLLCSIHEYCKSYNHNRNRAKCELIMTDYRLLETPTGNGELSYGWRHYSKTLYPRGCVGENARECVQFWVNTDLTSNVSVTSEWKLADEEGTLFIADQDRAHFNQFTVSNAEHFTQQGLSIPSAIVVHNLSRSDRQFVVPGANIPGVHYDFILREVFNDQYAQFKLQANESTYPSEVNELSHLRVVTEHSVELHWVFHGTAAVLDIWNQPLGGSCPCSVNAINVYSHEVTGLVAGEEYTFFMQLTTAYGKKGPVTSLRVSTYTDTIQNSSTSGTVDLVLTVSFESGTGREIRLQITSELAGLDRKYYNTFS
ncbi:uncharacterized protein LOC142338066 [Convolutriloba macropyga]|uniref:uncharacterized protein LOC142338066 n=1 Tax=Convolutriloba macropyga TaxID=536237 RepID=UPI003F527BED